jgi:ATP-dependent RNA circularization protein (DNA/RNA ligase family)
MKNNKPLGRKSYGSIPHLIGSRLGEGDHHASPGQVDIATKKPRDKWDLIIVQEKLDGGNVGVAKLNGEIIALSRAGYLAETSPYKTHHAFAEYVRRNEKRFAELLNENERVCGEWMLTAVGTKYKLPHEPFVPFDLMTGTNRVTYHEFLKRVSRFDFTHPRLIHMGQPISIKDVEKVLDNSTHGALEPVEGAVWRIERNGVVDFLVKYVRMSKQDGIYLDEDVFNELPMEYEYLMLPFKTNAI